tara:strand:- start:649 stop:1026 length:378 start_codon:yes stop_codon:yes gene_type:complete
MNKDLYNYRLMQCCLLITSFTCIFIGSARLYLGAAEISLQIDNILRFYAAGFIALGFLAFWVSVTIKKQNELIYFFIFFILMVGIGRLVSVIFVGLPDKIYLLYLGLEFSLPLIMATCLYNIKKK